MAETDGRTLGRLIGERHPGLPMLYVSAYPEHDMFHRGSPSPSAPFLQKPFTSDALLITVSDPAHQRRALDFPASMRPRGGRAPRAGGARGSGGVRFSNRD